MANYVDQCGGCIEYDFQGDDVKGYCSWYKCYYYPGDSCRHQTPREQVFSTLDHGSSCYVTTIICDVLGYSDDCEILQKLRGFRNNVLQKDEKYKNLLMEYDVVGPMIANYIRKDYKEFNDKDLYENFYESYLKRTVNFIDEKEYDKAVKLYSGMVNLLKKYFSITDEDIKVSNYDMSNGGHGKVYIKKGENYE